MLRDVNRRQRVLDARKTLASSLSPDLSTSSALYMSSTTSPAKQTNNGSQPTSTQYNTSVGADAIDARRIQSTKSEGVSPPSHRSSLLQSEAADASSPGNSESDTSTGSGSGTQVSLLRRLNAVLQNIDDNDHLLASLRQESQSPTQVNMASTEHTDTSKGSAGSFMSIQELDDQLTSKAGP